jgi:hypothetical protein
MLLEQAAKLKSPGQLGCNDGAPLTPTLPRKPSGVILTDHEVKHGFIARRRDTAEGLRGEPVLRGASVAGPQLSRSRRTI